MADQIATGVQWVVDDSTGAITGYRRKINGVDTQFQASVSGGEGGGAVASVNGKTGFVVLVPGDVGAATAAQGAKADTASQPAAVTAEIGAAVAAHAADSDPHPGYLTQTEGDGRYAPLGSGGGGGGAEVISAAVHVSATTADPPSSGAYTAFGSAACTELRVHNDSGVSIEYQRGGAGVGIVLLPGQSRTIMGLSNANQIGIRRADWATAPVNASAATRSTLSGVAITSSVTVSTVSAVEHTLTVGTVVALPSAACVAAELLNTTGKALRYTTGASGNPLRRLEHGATAVVLGITNLSQVFIQPVDQVAGGFLRSLRVEVFSADSAKLIESAPAKSIDLRATVHLPDQMYPSMMPTPPVLTLSHLARPVEQLRKRGAIPLARFMTVSGITSNRIANCADVGTGDTPWGSTAVEYTVTGGFDSTTFTADALTTGINVANGSVHLTYAIPDTGATSIWTTSSLHYIDIDLFSAGTPASPGVNYHTRRISGSQQLQAIISASASALTKGYSIPIGLFSAVGAGADLADVKFARLTVKANSGTAVGAKFRPIKIEWVPNSAAKAAVVFIFDGPQSGIITNVLPILSRYGYPGNILLASSSNTGISTRPTPRQLQMLHHMHGWQIMHHTYHQETLRPMSQEELLAEHANYVAVMTALGISDTQDAGFGSSTVTNIQDYNLLAAQRHFRSLCLFLSPATTTSPFAIGETLPFGDPHRIRRVSFAGLTAGTYATMWQAHIDQAIAAKGIAVFGGHAEFNTGGTEYTTALATLIEYCRTQELAGNLEVLTMAGAISRAYE